MKIRTDFVSNSSSSSFVLVGKTFSYESIVKYIEQNFPNIVEETNRSNSYNLYYETVEDIISNEGIDYVLEKIITKFNAKLEYEIEQHCDEICGVCFGMNPAKMKDIETLYEFKEKVNKELNKLNILNIQTSSNIGFIHGGSDASGNSWFFARG